MTRVTVLVEAHRPLPTSQHPVQLADRGGAALAALPAGDELDRAVQAWQIADLPGHQLLNRALTELRRRRHSQRRRWLAGAAAAVLIAAVAAVTGTSQSHAPAGTDGGQVIAATDPTTRVHATATLHGEPAGTAITLRLSGVTPGLHCQLIAVAANGRREVASSWRATYHGQADVTGTTALPVAELDSLQVVTTDGTRLLTLPAHR